VLIITQPVPAALRGQTERVEAGFRDYQELSYQRTALKRLFAFTLTLALMLALLPHWRWQQCFPSVWHNRWRVWRTVPGRSPTATFRGGNRWKVVTSSRC
jgi:hypothetical protein